MSDEGHVGRIVRGIAEVDARLTGPLTEVTLSGKKSMIAAIRAIQQIFPDAVAKALRIEAEIEATECKKRAPVYVGKTGPGYPIPGLLRASIHVEGPFRKGSRIWCLIVAGGAAGAYALRQHEELEWFHQVGQAKYIESVIMESRPHMAQRVADRVHLSDLAA